MTTRKSGTDVARRFDALMQWRQDAERAGHTVPSEAELHAFAAADGRPDNVDEAVCGPWHETIDFILARVERGAQAPADLLPERLRSPKPPQRPAEPGRTTTSNGGPLSSPTQEMTFGALRAWREAGLSRRDDRFSGLKESALRHVVRSHARSAEAIAAFLPASASGLAVEMAEVLSRFSGEPATAPTTGPAPATAPASASPAPRPTAPASPGAGPFPLAPEDFVDYDFSTGAEHGPPSTLRLSSSGGHVAVRWQPFDTDEPVVVYRVVSGDDYEPYAPEKSALLTVTQDCRASDERPSGSAVRYYQVWANAGGDARDAAEQQPVLHARAAMVAPVRDVELREDEGRVVGQWSVWPGTTRVHVFRVPIERAASAALDPAYRILAQDPNLTGFVDREAVRGQRYLYQVAAEAPVERTSRLSSPVSQDVLVSTVLQQVDDLQLASTGDDDTSSFDLTWTTPPGGRVVVYRTSAPPRADAGAAPMAEEALAQASLALADRLPQPVSALEGGRSTMRDVPWPHGWHRAFFTPVTLLDGRARVGGTRTAARSAPVRDVRIVERVQQQVVTFAWPEGANEVHAHLGARGQDATSALGGTPIEISQARYNQLGGLTFSPPLPRHGCSLHLVSVTFEGGSKITGRPTTVAYPGLVLLEYDVALRRNVVGAPAAVSVSISASEDLSSCPPFVLVHNKDRLPLDVRDGTVLEVYREDDPAKARSGRFLPPGLGPEPNGVAWRAEVKGLGGFVRLFADLEPDHLATVALLDPSVSRLQLGSRVRFGL